MLMFGILLIIIGYALEANAKETNLKEELDQKRHLDLLQQMDAQSQRQMDLQVQLHNARLATERELMARKKRTVSRRRIEKSPDGYVRAEELKYEEDME